MLSGIQLRLIDATHHDLRWEERSISVEENVNWSELVDAFRESLAHLSHSEIMGYSFVLFVNMSSTFSIL